MSIMRINEITRADVAFFVVTGIIGYVTKKITELALNKLAPNTATVRSNIQWTSNIAGIAAFALATTVGILTGHALATMVGASAPVMLSSMQL